MPLEYISLKEAAAKWRTKPWYIAKACEAGQVPGAAKLGETWIIPADLERPEMHIPKEEPESRPVQHGSDYKDHIYRSTMRGFPDFNVIVEKIDGTIYTIGGLYDPGAKYTFVERAVNAGLREYPSGKIPKDVKKLADEIKRDSRAKIPTSEQLRQYYRYKFEEIGFTAEEIAELMSKIEEYIQTRNLTLGIE